MRVCKLRSTITRTIVKCPLCQNETFRCTLDNGIYTAECIACPHKESFDENQVSPE